MTVIAYRDGIMAADDAVWDDSGHVVGTAVKIRRLADGSLVGSYGEGPAIKKAEEWIAGGADADRKPTIKPGSFACIWVRPNGVIERLTEELVEQRTAAPFFALSCRPGFTLGCLHAGATAEEAVRLTLQFTDAGGGSRFVQVERLNGFMTAGIPPAA